MVFHVTPVRKSRLRKPSLSKPNEWCIDMQKLDNNLLDEAAIAEKAGLVEVKRVLHPNYDYNTLNELAQLKH